LTRRIRLTRQLNTFDATNLVVGSTIGADIYVAAALCAKLLGSASLLIWFIGGVMAIVIALSFAYCASILPRAGGPYAYAKAAAGPFSGFMVGWALLLAEWFSLAVFPVAFTQYFMAFVPGLDALSQIVVKGAFMSILVVTNWLGVKAAGKFNDALTIAKVSPLLLLIGLGIIYVIALPQITLSRFLPFFGGDPNNIGQVLVIVFWAYAGFELSTLPADEVKNPKKTIPRAITVGMLIVAVFYIFTNFVVIAAVDRASLASSQAPLTAAAANMLSLSPTLAWIGSLVVGVGALISIMGADESGTIGTSRLAFAMSVDGLLPRAFSKLHKTYRTPYIALAVLCSTAFAASIQGTLTVLVNSSVFLLSFAYLATGISTYLLESKHRRSTEKEIGRLLVPTFTVIFSLVLMTQVTEQQILVSLVLLAVGVPLYTFFSPKKELQELKEAFLSREAILERTYHQEEVFLAYVMRRVKLFIYRRKGIQKAWSVNEEEAASVKRKNTGHPRV